MYCTIFVGSIVLYCKGAAFFIHIIIDKCTLSGHSEKYCLWCLLFVVAIALA